MCTLHSGWCIPGYAINGELFGFMRLQPKIKNKSAKAMRNEKKQEKIIIIAAIIDGINGKHTEMRRRERKLKHGFNNAEATPMNWLDSTVGTLTHTKCP